jgi:cysteine-rich repeat protein
MTTSQKRHLAVGLAVLAATLLSHRAAHAQHGVQLVWTHTTGSGTPGGSSIEASPGDVVTLDLVVDIGLGGLEGGLLALAWDPARTTGETAVTCPSPPNPAPGLCTPDGSLAFYQSSPPFVGAGFADDFFFSLFFTTVPAEPGPATMTIGRIAFTVGESDRVSVAYTPGVHGLADGLGGVVEPPASAVIVVDGLLPDACGDGSPDTAEACDDGNNEGGDGCRPDCSVELCGDEFLDPAEACDGGASSGPAPTTCSSSCEIVLPTFSPPSLRLVWTGTTGAGTTGASVIEAAAGDTLTLDLIVDNGTLGFLGARLDLGWNPTRTTALTALECPDAIALGTCAPTFGSFGFLFSPFSGVSIGDGVAGLFDGAMRDGTPDFTPGSMTLGRMTFTAGASDTVSPGYSLDTGLIDASSELHQPPAEALVLVDGLLPSSCGDGNPDPGEACDDGNNESGDGCSELCESETGAVDLRPGVAGPARVNLRSAGVLPVAILGSSIFDVTDVDGSTLAFGPAGAPLTHENGPHAEDEQDEPFDFNEDGFPDALAHFRIQETGLRTSDTEACLTGSLLDGSPIEACGAVVVVVRGCGLGFELTLVLPPLLAVCIRRRRCRAPRGHGEPTMTKR